MRDPSWKCLSDNNDIEGNDGAGLCFDAGADNNAARGNELEDNNPNIVIYQQENIASPGKFGPFLFFDNPSL